MKTTNHAARKTAHRAAKNGSAASQPVDAEFTASEPEPIDAPMWPLYASLWLQPEISPSIPVWTGLAIERHFGIPSPGFLCSEMTPSNRSSAPVGQAILSPATPPVNIPRSGLAPLGWDPRALCRHQEGI